MATPHISKSLKFVYENSLTNKGLPLKSISALEEETLSWSFFSAATKKEKDQKQ